MRLSPGRIETEYIVRTLAEDRPCLRLQCGNFSAVVPSESYSVDGSGLCGIRSVPPALFGLTFYVSFKHRDRGFFFSSAAEAETGSVCRFRIPSELFRSDEHDVSVPRVISFFLGSVAVRAMEIPSLPLDAVPLRDEFPASRRFALEGLARSSGFPTDNEALLGRLNETLELVRDNGLEGITRSRGFAAFLDHRFILALVPAPDADIEGSERIPVEIRYGTRMILAEARIRGHLRVNAAFAVVCLEIADAQEEDKRFLYESLYADLYRG